jgi:hypothetical protein
VSGVCKFCVLREGGENMICAVAVLFSELTGHPGEIFSICFTLVPPNSVTKRRENQEKFSELENFVLIQKNKNVFFGFCPLTVTFLSPICILFRLFWSFFRFFSLKRQEYADKNRKT